jgi:hypothetical protein
MDERGISFQDIQIAIEEGGLLDYIINVNQKKYSGQRAIIVSVHEYVYVVPCIENETHIFFKTIIPSRKHTKKYLRN